MRQPHWIARHKAQTLALTAAAILAAACSDNKEPPTAPGTAQSGGKVYDANWFAATAKPKFTSEGGGSPSSSKTIPYWSSSFTDPTNGVTYPYTMVGTSPLESTLRSTTVPTVVIPFRFVFANGDVLDPTTQNSDGSGTDADLLKQSPIFTNYTYPNKFSGNGETTQYGDAIFRA